MRQRSSCQTALILLAICALTLSLATRYTVRGPEAHNVSSVKAHSADAKTQHLLSDGFQWTAPSFSFTLFRPSQSFIYAVSAVFPPVNLYSESWLYNRPPPTC